MGPIGDGHVGGGDAGFFVSYRKSGVGARYYVSLALSWDRRIDHHQCTGKRLLSTAISFRP